MRKSIWVVCAIIAAAVAAGVGLYSQGRNAKLTEMPRAVAFRVLLGVGDREPATWDGSVTVTPGRVLSIQGWRFAGEDSTDSRSSWKASTRRSIPLGAKKATGVVLEKGVIIAASDEAARFEVKTAQGNFSFSAGEIPFGEEKPFLDGKVHVDRVPDTLQLTSSTDDQDFPAIAQDGDTVYVTYVEFVHSDRSQEIRGLLNQAPANFDASARPAGGDQVFLMTYSKSKRAWSEPMPVSAPKQDIMRAAVAVDGRKRVWVFYAANRDGNFDIYAKSLAGGRWSSEIRLTSDPGTDLNPVAATDAKGRVWVAWQGFRGNNLQILAAAQNGDRFTRETVVSFSPQSDWDPSIAAAANGEVAVAWDTYDKGDYDVYFRRLKMDGEIRMDAPVPVAASQGFEARSSIAYDPQNRLWVAYEASTTKWGKDWGALETNGVSLYQDHNVRVKVFQGSQAFATTSELVNFAGTGRAIGQGAIPPPLPDPDLVKRRDPSVNPPMPRLPLNSFPRLTVDSQGTVYLSFRSRGTGRSQPGTVWYPQVTSMSETVWYSQVMYYDGANWKGPGLVPNTDNWIDMRAAMAAVAPGELMMIGVRDHRLEGRGRPGGAANELNADLYAANLTLNEKPRAAQLKPIPAEKPAMPDKDSEAERAQVATIRKYRAAAGSDHVQLMRGEFHRHTEISIDGGADGPIIDAYRYMIDAASMDWGGCCDHDNGSREYSWWIAQKLTDAYHLGTNYVPMFSYERSVAYPEGHRNTVMARRGVRPLARLPLSRANVSGPAPDTQMFYRYLRQFDGIVASHTSGTNMGTDWRDNDPVVEPVVEIYQGDRQNYEMPNAPRSNNAEDSLGGWRPLGFVSLALKKGYRLGFQASSDHVSTHMSYCNLWVTSPTREGIMEAFHKRRVYGATEDILADVRCGGHFMGEEFATSEPLAISVKLWGLANFAKVHIIKDGEYVYTTSPGKKTVDFVWKDSAAEKGKTSYYYVRGEQSDGEIVWVSPMWVTYTGQ